MKNRLTSNLVFGLAAASFFAVSAFAQEAAPAAAEAPAAALLLKLLPQPPLNRLLLPLHRKPLLRPPLLRLRKLLSLPLLPKKKPLNPLLPKTLTRAKWLMPPVTLSACSRLA